MENRMDNNMVWIDWANEVVSFEPDAGFESLFFSSDSEMCYNLQILLMEGFLFR